MDPPHNLESFIDRLAACGLFGRPEIDQFRERGHSSAAELADDLENRQVITSWQRHELWKGGAFFRGPGNYILLSKLGEGAYGTCHLVFDRHKRDALYALKQLKSYHHHNGQALNRFRREMKILLSLSDRNIIGITRLELGNAPWFAMEYVGGNSLKEWAGEVRLPISLACEICLQIAKGLQAALDQGIIHRDVAPANVLIVPAANRSLVVKLLDFGVARFLQDVGIRDTVGPLGHAAYMSLRSLEDPQQADTSDDLFALGCIFFELLTGRRPYALAHSQREQANILRTSSVPSVKALRSDVPDEVTQIVERLLDLPTRGFWQRFCSHPLKALVGLVLRKEAAKPQEIVDRLAAALKSLPPPRYQPPPRRETEDPPLPNPESPGDTEDWESRS